MADFDIRKLTGLLKATAEKIDNLGNKNGTIDGIEVSIFTNEANTLMSSGQISIQEYNSVFVNGNIESLIADEYICLPDKTRVEVKTPPPILNGKNTKTTSAQDNYKQDPQYERVSNLIISQYKSHGVQNPTQEQIDKVAKMVIELCNKYNVNDLAPVIAQMLGVESGGYNFNDKVMVHPKSQYKGVMQVDLETICCIYGTSQSSFKDIDGVARKSKRSKDIYVYDNNHHYKQDKQRIEELKAKYPTPKDLYQAIQKDAALGIEVGIIALKANISYSKGSIAGAIAKYCGSQYKCDLTGCPQKIDIGQRA